MLKGGSEEVAAIFESYNAEKVIMLTFFGDRWNDLGETICVQVSGLYT